MRRTRQIGWVLSVAILAAVTAVIAPLAAQDAASRAEAELGEARGLFDDLDYERAVPVLDRAIVLLEPLTPQQPALRASLANAYEMRGRARFGLGDRDGAMSDFRSLIGVDPAFAFSAQVSPRVVALLDEVKLATLGSLALTVDPADAVVELNGQIVAPGSAAVPLVAGDYTIRASRVGYKAVDETIAVAAGEIKQFDLTMERTSAAVFLMTTPPDVEVVVDGVSRGRTKAGALPTQYAEIPSQLGVAPEQVSLPLVLSDLTPGAHSLQFKRSCFVTDDRRLVVEGLADYRVEPVVMKRAVGSIDVVSLPAGAHVFVDGEPHGTAPMVLDDVCEGPRTVELRGTHGRFVQRVVMKTGERVAVKGALKPAFALLPAGNGFATAAGVTETRAMVERALAGSQQVTLFVPAGPPAEKALAAQAMPAEWLAFDAGRRPVGGAATIGPGARRDLSAKLARALDVQGVAAVSQLTPTSPELVIALLAAGAGEPDVVPVTIERLDSVNRAIARLDFMPPLARPGIGVLAVEVADVKGLVIARVDKGSVADLAGLEAGHVITAVDNTPVTQGVHLHERLEAKRPGEQVSLQVTAPGGASRTAQVPVSVTPRVISPSDQTLLFNPLSVALRNRLLTADAADQPIVRLNLAVALMRLGDYAGAREQLEAVQMPDVPGIGHGTQQYLLGLAYEGLGDVVAAQRAWQAAAATQSWLTEDGPAVKGLAERKLGAAGRPGGTP